MHPPIVCASQNTTRPQSAAIFPDKCGAAMFARPFLHLDASLQAGQVPRKVNQCNPAHVIIIAHCVNQIAWGKAKRG